MDSYLANPALAQRAAAEAARLAQHHGDLATASVAQRALGLIAQHLQDYGTAERHVRLALRMARQAADPVREGEARVNLAYMLSRQGRTQAALRQLAAAEPLVHGASAGWLSMTRAIVLKDVGRWDDALQDFHQALQRFRRAQDRRGEIAVLANRGVLHAYRGSLAAAEADLLQAERGGRELGQDFTCAITRHNLGYVYAQRGEVPAALRAFDEAEAAYGSHVSAPMELWVDRCELLLAAGLAVEARAAAERAVQHAERAHQAAELAEARLRLAQAALATHDPGAARQAADAAGRAFLRQRRPGWAALARYTVLLACMEEGRPVRPVEARRAARALDRAGWTAPARNAAMITATLELARGHLPAARRDLQQLAASRSRGTMWQRSQAWHAEALLRLSAGRRTGALRAAGRGLDLVEEHRATLGATDLRARASARLVDLAAFGTRLAVEGGKPDQVLRWAERSRAAHASSRPGVPPRDEVLAGLLTTLRRTVLASEAAARESRPALHLRSQHVAIESAIRDRSRLLAGAGAAPTAAVDVRVLAGALGERALVEYVVTDGVLHAVTVAGGRVRLHRLGRVAPVEHELSMVPFQLRRLVGSRRPKLVANAVDTLACSGQRLDAALLAPLADVVRDRPLVVVPTGALQSVPWAALPSCRGRAVSVAPSARLWLRAAARPAPERTAKLLVAGPGLAHADAEVLALARRLPEAASLVGEQATVDRVLAALGTTSLAHLAMHGDFRADNPQFSCLGLHDGPLTIYDLERLPRTPERVVLSACESGRSPVLAGDEVLGLAAAFLALGTRGVVASLVQVPDAETVPLMTALHDGLDRGQDLGAALAEAQAATDRDEPRALAAALAFVSFGCA